VARKKKEEDSMLLSDPLCLASFPHWGESSWFQMSGQVSIEAMA